MYPCRNWAKAYIKSLENEGLDIAEGIDTLQILSDQVKAHGGILFGRTAADKLEELLYKGIPLCLDITVRFLVLMVRKNMFRHVKPVINEIKNIMNKRWGIIEATVEYALIPNDKSQVESTIIQAVKRRSGVKEVVLESRHNPQILGGYRVKIGDEVIDASIRSQLDNLLMSFNSDEVNGGL